MSERTVAAITVQSDEQYDRYENLMKGQVASLTGPLFTTDVDPEALWMAYLSGFPTDRRQHYTCHACRRFIQRYGGLVTIDDTGLTTPALWNYATPLWNFAPPSFFAASHEAMRKLVTKAKVNGVFLSSEKVWGTPITGQWTHLSGISPLVFKARVQNADQVMAEKLEDYKMVSHGLVDYPKAVVDQALRVLRADSLDRSEKTLGVAEWFATLHEKVANSQWRNNLIWRAVATAPPGFCHVRSTMISTLLDDIANGMDFDSISRRWKEKMHPLRYQRPTASPTAGAIDQAEKLVERLGVAPSLDRRFATLDDVLSKVWVPREMPAKNNTGGVFGHLRKDKNPCTEIELPPTRITWEKFKRTVISDAFQMEIKVPNHGSFYGLVTAAHADAPPIIQWDGLDGFSRNPVSWYFYHNGSQARTWNLSAGWTKVTSVFLSPHAWQQPEKFAHQGLNVFFSIEKCWDTSSTTSRGLALFPEILKSEFHGIRSVIEAHSRKGGIVGAFQGTANGLAFNKGSEVTVRVKTPEGSAVYIIDRFD